MDTPNGRAPPDPISGNKPKVIEMESFPNKDIPAKNGQTNHDTSSIPAYDIDQVLEKAGSFGRFQKIAYPLIWLSSICFGSQMVAMMFLGYEPDYHCTSPNPWNSINSSTNQTVKDIFNVTLEKGSSMSECSSYRMDVNSSNGQDVSGSIVQCESWEYDQTDMSRTITTQWNIICERKWLQANAQSIFMAGFLIGCFIFGDLSDRFGRLLIMMICSVLQALVGVVVAWAPGYPSFVALRFFVGVFTAGQKNSGYVMCLELVGPKWREVVAFLNDPFFSFGLLLVGLCAYLTGDWRYTTISVSAPSLLLLVYIWWLPESPRWLAKSNQQDKAVQAVRKIARFNRVSLPEKFVITVKDQKVSRNVWDLFRTKVMAIRTCLLLYIWFVGSFVFYGIAFGATQLVGNMWINFVISGLVEIPGYLLVMVLSKKLGRRLTLIGFMLLAGVTCVAVPFIPKHLSALSITLTMVGKMAISGAVALPYMYTTELYPTMVRNLALGTGNMIGKVGAMLAPFVALLEDISPPLPIVIFGMSAGIAGLCTWFLPETNGVPLPDTLEDAQQIGKKKVQS